MGFCVMVGVGTCKERAGFWDFCVNVRKIRGVTRIGAILVLLPLFVTGDGNKEVE